MASIRSDNSDSTASDNPRQVHDGNGEGRGAGSIPASLPCESCGGTGRDLFFPDVACPDCYEPNKVI